MYKYIIILLLLFSNVTYAFTCGIKPIKPIPPIGCSDLIAQCVCDSNGNCYWNWLCV